MSKVLEVSKDNALSDASDLAEEIDRNFKDEDIATYTRAGINLVAAADRFVEKYEGDNSFVISLKGKREKYGSLTTPQARGALNVLRQEHLGLKAPAADSRETREYNCFKCEEIVVGITALYAHKKSCRGKAAPVVHKDGIDVDEEEEEDVPVIAVTTSTLNLDLSLLPDGRYAAPDLNNDRDNDFLFFSVSRTKRDKTRNRRFRYSKFRPGREHVPAGTIEVKEWSSDTKRLFGEQRPGLDKDGREHVYTGEFEEHIKLIMANPEAWARLFGQMIGRCFRCGKKLTDEDSRSVGHGPECAKHINEYRGVGV